MPNNMNYEVQIRFGGHIMKLVVVKSPKFLTKIFRLIFKIKKDELEIGE